MKAEVSAQGEVGSFRHAYVDESMIGNGPRPSIYILSAALVSSTQADNTRQVMTALKQKSAKKLHWRDEKPSTQARLIKAVMDLRLEHTIVVRSEVGDERQERQRRLCMERLMQELYVLGVRHVTFESRGPADDKRDMDLIRSLRAKKSITADLRASHVPGPTEPLLWIADIVCGAVSQHQQGFTSNFAEIKADTRVHYL